ncbi:MAG: polyprenyl synthetase family protein [Brumimicrobium sp.]
MDKVEVYQEILEDAISKIAFPSSPKNLYNPLRYFLKISGKRTRPTLTMLGCSLYGEDGIKALNTAIAIELFHNFTLIHDDIMDEAPLRRGQQTVHEKWNSDIGILSGDTLFTIAVEYLAKNDREIIPDLINVFTRTSREVCEGQQLDMDFETLTEVSIDDYIEMIRLKTSVLIGAALEMGAIVAGVKDKDEIQKIYTFGLNVGLAFQIQDDLLDLYSESGKFGKQKGGDILANKKTFLLLKAFELASEEQKDALNHALSDLQGNEKIIAVKTIFDALNIKEEAEKLKNQFYQLALKQMDAVQVPNKNKSELLKLAESLMSRDF